MKPATGNMYTHFLFPDQHSLCLGSPLTCIVIVYLYLHNPHHLLKKKGEKSKQQKKKKEKTAKNKTKQKAPKIIKINSKKLSLCRGIISNKQVSVWGLCIHVNTVIWCSTH